MIIVAPDGTEVECFVTQGGPWIDAILRAESKDAFEQAAVAHEIFESVGGALVPVRGNNVDVLGPVLIAHDTYDERYHVNLRIAEPALSKLNDDGYPKWKATVLAWMASADDSSPNKNEAGKVFEQVTLINPLTIATPRRVWL